MSKDGKNGRHSRSASMSDDDSDATVISARKIVTYRSRSKEVSRSSGSPKSKDRYSRTRSRSRSHHRSRRSRSRHRSRSRSMKRHRSRYSSRSFSRSRSYSYSPYRGSSRRYHRSHSRSPMSNRRRHNGTRVRQAVDNPKPSKCLGVFGLSVYTTEGQLHHIFSKFGSVNKVQVVIDAKSGRSRGFAFVYFDLYEDAKLAKDQCTGLEIDGRQIRVDYSVTQRAHTPTPGIYMGKPTYSDGRWRDDDYYGGGGRGGGGGRYDRYKRSPSPYYSSRRRSRYDRSRSRTHSPRRYY